MSVEQAQRTVNQIDSHCLFHNNSVSNLLVAEEFRLYYLIVMV